jgi:biopolymer transport protein ExbD
MTNFRLRSALLLIFAAVFILFSLYSFAHIKKPAVGFYIPTPRVQRHALLKDCEDDIPLVVKVKKDGSTWINMVQLDENKIAPEIALIMQNRAEERVVYLLPDPEIPYEKFISIYDEVQNSAKILSVIVVTDQVYKQMNSTDRADAICDFEWPENGYKTGHLFPQQ